MTGEKLTKLLNIEYPIIQGGMAGVSDSSLVSAVSNAGGLGVIGTGFLSPSWLEKEIEKTRELTDKPFGVNLMMQNPNVPKLAEVIIKKKVEIVFTGGGNPLALFPYLKKIGIKIIPVVSLARLAKKMEQNGADAVVVEGMESGGHIGRVTTFILLPQAKKLLENIPLIAAGGIYNSKTALACFNMGADGVQLGTRFLATKECNIHENYKKAVLEASDEDIVVLGEFTGHPVRLIENDFTKRIKEFEKKNPFPEEIRVDMFSSSKLPQGNVNQAPLLCGLCAGAITEIKSCQEILEEIMEGLKDYKED